MINRSNKTRSLLRDKYIVINSDRHEIFIDRLEVHINTIVKKGAFITLTHTHTHILL